MYTVRGMLAALFLVGVLHAGERPRFTDVTAKSGIKVNTSHRPGRPDLGTQMPHGVAIEDFDNDGKLDILLVCFGEPHVQLFRNLGGMVFQDITRDSGLETFKGWGTGAAVADFDRDGNLDVYLTSVQFDPKDRKVTPTGCESRLYRGLGNGKFVDVSSQTGTLLTKPARCCCWSDVDGDGWLDLFIACPHTANVLYRNNGGRGFTDIAAEAGVALPERANLGCAFGDIDGDGRDDLFVTSYYSQVSALFRNLGGGRFRDVTTEAGLARKASAVGCVFADVFNRGRLDLHVTTDSWLSGANSTEAELLKRGNTVEPNVLYENSGNETFTPVSASTLLHKTLSHDAVLEDLDHDGWIDIYVGVDAIPTGNKFATHKGGNPLWTRPDGRTWKETRDTWGVGFEANCVCVPAADFDNDGDLDLLLVNFYDNVVLYRNETNDKNWLRVRVADPKSHGIGAKVRVYENDAGKRQLLGFRQIHSGAGYGRSSPLEAHFGLGSSKTRSFDLEVEFPGSDSPTTQKDVSPGQVVVIRRTTDAPR